MKAPLRTAGEPRRLEALRQYQVLDTLSEQALDDLTSLAVQICEVPIALISLVDEDRQWFKSRVGVSASETSRDVSFCGHAILQPDLFIVPDATQDDRFADNPLVTGEPHIRFYGGAPLITADGHALGALCVIDHVPRQLNASQQDALLTLSRQVMAQLELRRQSRELAEKEARLRLALQAAHMGMFDWDMQRDTITWSQEHEQLWGFKRGEFDGQYTTFAQRVHPEDLPGVNAEVARCIAARVPFDCEYRVVWPDGSVHWVEGHGEFTFDDGGKPVRMRGVVQETTARRRSEDALRERENQLRLYAEYSPAAIAMLDRDMRYLVASHRWMENYRLGDQSIVGRSHNEVFPEIPPRWTEVHRRCLAGAVEKCDEDPFPRADGRIDWIHWEIRPWRQADGTIGGIIIFSEDITERKQAEQRIKQLNRVYAVLSDINQTIVREKDTQAMLNAACRIAIDKGRFHMSWIGLANPSGGQIRIAAHAGATADTLQLFQALAGGEQPDCAFTFHALQAGEHGFCNDIKHDPKAASWRAAALQLGYHSMASLPLKVGDKVIGTFNLYAGEPGFFDAEELRLLDELALDISHALEVGQREAERSRLGHVIEASLNEIYLFDADTQRFEYVNAGAQSNIGYSLEELRGRTPLDLKPEFTEASFRELIQPLLDREKSKLVFETIHRRADGSRYPVEVHLQLVEQPGHRVFVAIILDLTERRQAEASLRRNEERFRLLIENASDLITVINNQGIIRYQSPSVERVLGYTPEQLVGRNVLDFVHPDDATASAAAIQQDSAIPTAPNIAEYRIRHKNGKWRTFQSVGRDIPGQAEDGFVVINSRDITETRQLEEQFRQAQKLEAIGQLAGGVAHDFNNILTVIQGYGTLLMMPDQDPADAVDSAREIVQASERAANLTRQLLAFSRRQVMHTRVLDLNDIVTSLAKMLQRIVGEDVRLQLNLHTRPLQVRADAGMLDQVLLNLVVNARDAMPRGGRLSISTAEKTLTRDEAAAIPDAAPGRYFCLRVADTGTGIAPEILSRIFEPFFTTKEPGKGTGLGLATVFGIVKQHGGSVGVESEIGRGTVFEILLPAVDDAGKPSDDSDAARKLPGGSETVLLVEDDSAVRMLTRVVLERAGYRVMEAANGVAALKLVGENPESVQLLFTDMVMPEGMGGRELAKRLQALNPELRVIFTSGYSADIAGRELSLQEARNFIQKPSSPQQILETVRRCLDG